MGKTVLILGGSMAGLGVAHRLLKYTLPNEKDLKVIMVSKNSHLYWNLASVRAVIPGLIKDEELFIPVEPGFKAYPQGCFEFVLGAATKLDKDAKSVTVNVATTPATTTRVISYDYLVVATGARAEAGVPWKASGTYEECLESLHETTAAVGAAKSVVVAGAGATGIELAAEIKDAFGDAKEVILLSAGAEIVGGDPSAPTIEKELNKLNVIVKKGVQASGFEKQEDGRTEVMLSNGETLITDLYLPATGLMANTEFLPSDCLNERKYVEVDAENRVKGLADTWALGDVVSKPRGTFILTDIHAACLVKNIELAMKGKEQLPMKTPSVDVFILSTGRTRGAGRAGSLRVPSLFIWFIKGRTLGRERAPKYVNGSMW